MKASAVHFKKFFSKAKEIIFSFLIFSFLVVLLVFNFRTEKGKEYLEKAKLYSASSCITEAINAYEKGLSLAPSALDFFTLGNLYASLDDFQKAVGAYKSSLRLDADNAMTYSKLGSAYNFLGLYKDAVEAYGKSVSIEPNNHEVYSNLGMVYGFLGEHDKAVEYLKQAIAIKPDSPEAHNNLGVEYVRLKKYKPAEIHFKKALEFNPDLPDAQVNLFILFSLEGRAQEAEGLKRKVGKIVQENPDKYIAKD